MSTTDPNLSSWVESANVPGCDFPIQNLPYGVFRRVGSSEAPRIGVAIGDVILDLRKCVDSGVLGDLDDGLADALWDESINALAALGRDAWRDARARIQGLFVADCPVIRDRTRYRKRLIVPMADTELLVPGAIGDYTDFYASIHHATNIGSMFRPDNPLLPNYRNLPVGYHGRASSIVASGAAIRRPHGQTKADDADLPTYGPCRLLDYELEVGCFVGPGNELGTPIPIADAASHIFGLVLLNDWSARDIQKWEYQPLGPFNAKNFVSTISPWVVTIDALEPFLRPGPPRGTDDPPLLDYLKPATDAAIDLTLEVLISSQTMREKGMEPSRISLGTFREMYWTFEQMIAHHTSTGCNLQPGDLLGSGTVSGPDEASRGCLLERTWRGQNPITIADGTERKLLQDGDEVIIRGWCEACEAEGATRIGLGECRGVVLPA
jgi:fumarylacetoacetase